MWIKHSNTDQMPKSLENSSFTKKGLAFRASGQRYWIHSNSLVLSDLFLQVSISYPQVKAEIDFSDWAPILEEGNFGMN